MTASPFVSVVVPCRDEARHIRQTIDSIVRSDYPRDRLEAIFVDGMSRDGTREILATAARQHPWIRVLDNPRLTTPAAMNLGIARARGEVILRVDGHCDVPPDYLRRCVALLRATGAACAGGWAITVPNGERPWARAVAAVTRCAIGVGDSRFRTGGPAGFVDTVPGGAFVRAALDRVGPFDERLTRNQDNELTARLRKSGYKIAFDPAIRFRYWNQPSLRGLAEQGFRTGMWNVYALVLHPYTWKGSRFVPALFVLYLAVLGALLAGGSRWSAAAASPLGLYASLLAAFALRLGAEEGGSLRFAVTAASYHLCYGLGTHAGLANVVLGRWRRHLGRPVRP